MSLSSAPEPPDPEPVAVLQAQCAALVQQLEQFRAVFDTISEAVGLLDLQGKLLDMNPSLSELIGCQRQEAIGQRVWELPIWAASLETQQQLRALIDQAASGQTGHLPLRLPHPQGEGGVVHLSIKPIANRLGAVLLLSPQPSTGSQSPCSQPGSQPAGTVSQLIPQLKSILDSSIIGIFFCTPDGQITEANDVFLNLIHYTRADLQANRLRWDQITPPDYQQIDQQISEDLARDHVSAIYEKEYICKDGQRIPVLVKVAVLEQKPQSLEIAFVLDISEHKRSEAERMRAEAALLEHEERLRLISEAVNLGVWELNLVTCEEVWSEKVHAIYGIAPGQHPPTYQDFYNSIHPEDRELVKQANQQALQTGLYRAEHRILRPDGSVHWISGVGKVFYDQTGVPVRLSGLDADITEHKQTQQQLLIAQERLQHLLSASSAIVYSATTGNPYDFTFMSDNITTVLGYLADDCLNPQFWMSGLHPEDASEVLDRLPLLERQGFLTFEYRFCHKDGSYRWLYDQRQLVRDKTGQPLEIVGSLIDISDRRWAETALREQAAQERALNRLKDDFLSTVSHELRTPITNIRMAVQMLQMVLSQKQPEDERVTRYLRILQEQCFQEMNLINNLLDLQFLEAGARPLQSTPIDLQTWVPELIDSFSARIHDQQQVLSVDIAEDLPPLHSDRVNLKRILSELLNNACKYTPSGEQIRISVTGSHQSIQFKIGNSGVEIPSEELLRIFDKFYRVTGTDRWKHAGTGLGLALVKGLTELLGGTIEVESSANWTSFVVELPIDLHQSGSMSGDRD